MIRIIGVAMVTCHYKKPAFVNHRYFTQMHMHFYMLICVYMLICLLCLTACAFFSFLAILLFLVILTVQPYDFYCLILYLLTHLTHNLN
ncbi:hypothetical protein EB796_007223 [Bugula neritina]|uniref:Uncharacterized protein n=1 Tax=Bugula neritina TaxID=10212 RepID=A0A7J7K9D9_BUGNE|nr:hypothetical protein EB796_007223 [Bugula neritina]